MTVTAAAPLYQIPVRDHETTGLDRLVEQMRFEFNTGSRQCLILFFKNQTVTTQSHELNWKFIPIRDGCRKKNNKLITAPQPLTDYDSSIFIARTKNQRHELSIYDVTVQYNKSSIKSIRKRKLIYFFHVKLAN